MRKFTKLWALALILCASAVVYAKETERSMANYFNFGAGCLIAISDGGASPGPGITVS